jgi:hypothetical protein
MTDSSTPAKDHREPDTPHRRIAFERLRERTDELELLVSGLTVFALFSAPGFIVSLWLRTHVHLDDTLYSVLRMVTQVAIGLCYALALMFLLHIIVRAYWIGLIGLKSAFPDGIRWDKARSIGPFTRSFYQKRLPDLDAGIDSADRLASMIFAAAGFVAITTVWTALLFSLVIALLELLASYLQLSPQTMVWLLIGFTAPFAVLSLSIWFIEYLVRRRPALADSEHLRRFVHGALAINTVMPQSLIMPLQLTLQSRASTRGIRYLLLALFFLVPVGGALIMVTQQQFSTLGRYNWLNDDDVVGGIRSAHYEDLRTSADIGQPVPTIPSDRVAEAWLRLFLPHMPARDNAVLNTLCADKGADAAARQQCVAGLWQVRLGERAISSGDFVPAERRDMGWRGFQVFLSMQGLAPGRHDLEVVWNGDGGETGPSRRRVYRIPFWLSPGYEMSVP